MSYVVLARKWRPMRFEDLVGQDHVARTLGNAIDAGRVAHAFLFTGVRGVGKTTSARILAKALNCMREPGSLEAGAPDPGPTVTPCLKCPACLEIAEGRDTDVQEIDGASYNGVDEVRKLQDSLPYRPSRDRFKIVIVDEVHMLTAAAWNAFLKTLEEPPPHVKFIFATTEAHKVPITILSRVQRFDFKMIPTRLIMDRLKWVLAQEESDADDTALGILARQAAGSMRDAMSLLDQVIAFGGDKLAGDDVARVLGVASRGALVDIARALVTGDAEKCLTIVGALADQGFDIPHVTKDIHALLRDLVVAKVCKNPDDLLDLADEEKADVLSISRDAGETDLLRLHQAFSKGYDDVMRGGDPRAGLEMLLVRLAGRPPLLPLDELLHRIGNLEKRLSQAGAQRPRGGPQGRGGAGPAPRANRSREQSDSASPSTSSSGPGNDDDVHDAGSAQSPSPTNAPVAQAAKSPAAQSSSGAAPTPAPSPAPTAPSPQSSTTAATRAGAATSEAAAEQKTNRSLQPQSHSDSSAQTTSGAASSAGPTLGNSNVHSPTADQSALAEERPEDLPFSSSFDPETVSNDRHPFSPEPETSPAPVTPPASSTQSAEPSQAEPAQAPAAARAKDTAPRPAEVPAPTEAEAKLFERMAEVTDALREEHMELSAYLEQTMPIKADGNTLELGLQKGHIFERQLTANDAQKIFGETLKRVWGDDSEFRIVLNCAEALPEKSLSSERARQRRAAHLAAVEEVKRHPLVQEATRIFAAQVRSVTLPDQA